MNVRLAFPTPTIGMKWLDYSMLKTVTYFLCLGEGHQIQPEYGDEQADAGRGG